MPGLQPSCRTSACPGASAAGRRGAGCRRRARKSPCSAGARPSGGRRPGRARRRTRTWPCSPPGARSRRSAWTPSTPGARARCSRAWWSRCSAVLACQEISLQMKQHAAGSARSRRCSRPWAAATAGQPARPRAASLPIVLRNLAVVNDDLMLVLMRLLNPSRRPRRTPRRGAGCSRSHGLLVRPELLLSYCSCGGASAAIRRQSPATRRRRNA